MTDEPRAEPRDDPPAEAADGDLTFWYRHFSVPEGELWPVQRLSIPTG